MNSPLEHQILEHLNRMGKGNNQADQESDYFLFTTAVSDPNYIQCLSSLILKKELSEEIKLKATLILKNLIKKMIMDESPKNFKFFQDNCFNILLSCSSLKVGNSVCEIIYLIMLKYYPSEFPEAEDILREGIKQSGSLDNLFWYLKAYCKLAKVREHSLEEVQIEIKNQSVNLVFPNLEQYMNDLLQTPLNTQNIMILYLLAKIYCKSVRYDLPKYFYNQEKLNLWMEITKRILGLESEDPSVQSDLIKTKKWMSRALVSFFRKYGKPNLKDPESDEYQLATYFTATFSNDIIMIGMEIVKNFNRELCSLPENKLALNFTRVFLHAFKNKQLVDLSKNMIPFVQNVIIPKLEFTVKDKEMYEDDPAEYFKRNDEYLSSISFKEGAVSLAFEVFYKHPEEFKEIFMKEINNSVNNPLKREVYYMIYEKLHEVILDDESFVNFNNIVFSQFLPADLVSEHGFLVARACRIIYRFVTPEFNTAVLTNVFEPICNNLKHNDLPVRCSAALALNSLLSNKDMADNIRPYLKDILIIYVKLVQEMENESLINSLKGIFEIFANEIEPFAFDLVSTIVNICLSILQKQQSNENVGDELEEFAFMSGINSIEFLVKQTKDSNTVERMAEVIYPLAKSVLFDLDIESFEEMVYLISTMFKKTKGKICQPLKNIYEYIIYGLGDLNIIRNAVNNKTQFQNELFIELAKKNNEMFLDLVSPLSSLLRNIVYNHWECLKSTSDEFGNNLLELLFAALQKSLEYKSQFLESTNKVCLLMLQSTLIISCNKFNPELLAESSLIQTAILSATQTLENAKKDDEEVLNIVVYENILLHNIGIALTANPLKTISVLETNGQLGLITDNFTEKFSKLLTFRIQKAFFLGILSLISQRKNISNNHLNSFLNSPELFCFMTQKVFKLYILEEIRKVEESEEMMLNNESTKSEISKILAKFKSDPVILLIEEEICTEYEDHEVEVEILMAFDFDTCDEVFDEYNEFDIFKNFLENEKQEEVFNLYWGVLSNEMKHNLQVLFG